MLIKIHNSYRMVVAVCDSDLVGKILEDSGGVKQLDLTSGFFKGDEKSKEEIKGILISCLKEDATFNFVGKESCNTALEVGIIKKDGIIKIQEVPVALALL